MKLSARNQISGKVTNIKQGQVNAQVSIEVTKDVTLISTITNLGVKELALSEGDKVIAIIKASSVILSSSKDVALSARNVLSGTITEVKLGEVNAQVSLDVGNGVIITSVITVDSANRLGLAAGKEAVAIIKASNVIIGK